jgi:flagellar basal body-associated protein FliL
MDNETTGQAAANVPDLESTAKKKVLMFGAVLLVTMGCAAGAGYLISRLVHGGGAEGGQAGRPASTRPADSAEEPMSYVNLDPIIVNANEPKLQRFIRAVITLAVTKENASAVSELVNKRKDEVKNWLVTYLAGCSLEEVRGPKNLNRVRREILDMLNEQFWPNQRPRIGNVLFKEFQVQ